MRASGRIDSQVDRSTIIIASVLLWGIVVMAVGHFPGKR